MPTGSACEDDREVLKQVPRSQIDSFKAFIPVICGICSRRIEPHEKRVHSISMGEERYSVICGDCYQKQPASLPDQWPKWYQHVDSRWVIERLKNGSVWVHGPKSSAISCGPWRTWEGGLPGRRELTFAEAEARVGLTLTPQSVKVEPAPATATIPTPTPEKPVWTTTKDERVYWCWTAKDQGFRWARETGSVGDISTSDLQHCLTDAGHRIVADPPIPPKPEKVEEGWRLIGECREPKRGETYVAVHENQHLVYCQGGQDGKGPYASRRWIVRQIGENKGLEEEYKAALDDLNEDSFIPLKPNSTHTLKCFIVDSKWNELDKASKHTATEGYETTYKFTYNGAECKPIRQGSKGKENNMASVEKYSFYTKRCPLCGGRLGKPYWNGAEMNRQCKQCRKSLAIKTLQEEGQIRRGESAPTCTTAPSWLSSKLKSLAKAPFQWVGDALATTWHESSKATGRLLGRYGVYAAAIYGIYQAVRNAPAIWRFLASLPLVGGWFA